MAEVAVKKRGRPKKVAVDGEVIVRVLEATTADEPKTRGKAASPTSSSLAKKSTSKAAITTSTTTSSTAAKKVKVLEEDKKVTVATTATPSARKRATKVSSPGSTSTSSAIITDPVGKTATTPTLEPGKVEGLVIEAKTSTTENHKLSAEKQPATTTAAARSATTTATPTVVKSTRTATSAVKAEVSSLPIPASTQSDRQLQNQARLSEILQQAKAFSKHSDDLHRSLLELVGDREVAYASVQQALETQTGKALPAKEIEVLVSSESPVAATTATSTETATVTSAATPTSTTVASDQRLQQKEQNQDQKSAETTTISAGQNEKGPEAPIKPKVTLEELVALVEAAISAPATAAPLSQGAPEVETIATVNQPALTTKATPDETMRQPPAIAPTVYIPSASMPLPSPQAWWSRPIPRYVLPASTITALAARGINTTNIQRQQPPSSHEPGTTSSGPSFPKRAGAGAGIGAGAGGFGAGGVSLPPSRPPPPPIQPKRPSEMPLKELKKDPKYRLLSSRWTRIMVALPVAIVSSYVLWERYEEQQAYRRAKEAKDRLERLGLGTSESNPYK
ncbi:hypothetical protein PV11_09316 [Exophiala sideris]|uniref:Uncharacterized protein n=1 Tax=Exophiala sideris TaxID=1016849 RepID=A0A0D1WR45_9EURO|nr:hypothetical protein PV11_09316 [Exophiala sideris]